MQQIQIRAFPIELYKVLQIADWVDSGGEAKALIADGQVCVNGEVELRKRRKCALHDQVQLGEQLAELIVGDGE